MLVIWWIIYNPLCETFSVLPVCGLIMKNNELLTNKKSLENIQLLRIDIISDVMCPWCVIGYLSLQQAIQELNKELRGVLAVDIHWQPFELNPNMPDEGQELGQHIMEKYGSSEEQSQASRKQLIGLGKSLGFEFNFPKGKRILNTFKAHQLLHWMGENTDQQTALKLALFKGYFSENKDVNDIDELLAIAAALDMKSDKRKQMRQALEQQTHAQDVRELQQQWRQLGVTAVPTFIIDKKYMMSGGQPKEAFMQGLRQVVLA